MEGRASGMHEDDRKFCNNNARTREKKGDSPDIVCSSTRRSEYKYGIAMAHVGEKFFVRGCRWLGDEEQWRLWCCGKELWGLGWATDVVCTQQLGEERRRVWLGLGRKGGKREEQPAAGGEPRCR